MAKTQPNAKVPTTTKLVGKGREGDIIHQTQTMGTEQGFKNVSQLWLDRGCLSYDVVAEKIEKGRSEIEDFTAPLKAIQPAVTDDGQFTIRYEGVNLKPTEFALGQIAGWAGVSNFDVEMLAGTRKDTQGRLRTRPQDRETLVTLLQSGFSLMQSDKKFLLRTQKDGTLRAWLSDKYERLDNLWFLEVLKDIIPGGLFSHWKDDGDFSTLWGNILIPDSIRAEADSEYGAMFSIGNSEIGRRKLNATPSLFRAICQNGCIWSRTRGTAFRQIHRGAIDLMVLRNELRKHLTSQIPLINNSIDDLMSTRTIGWDGAAAKPVFAALGQSFRLTKAINTSILSAWREQAEVEDSFKNDDNLRRSAFAVINAVTRSATKEENPSDWVERDLLGGQLLDWKKPEWSQLFGKAKTMKGEEVAAAFVMSHN